MFNTNSLDISEIWFNLKVSFCPKNLIIFNIFLIFIFTTFENDSDCWALQVRNHRDSDFPTCLSNRSKKKSPHLCQQKQNTIHFLFYRLIFHLIAKKTHFSHAFYLLISRVIKFWQKAVFSPTNVNPENCEHS